MKIITFEDIIKLNIPLREAYDWTEEIIEHKERCYLPAKISMKPQDKDGVFYNVMPCIIPKEDTAGVKLVTRYPDGIPALNSQLMLCDLENGNLLALMDANYITALRTACVAVHSIELFAKKDFDTIGLMGLGNIMRATIKVFAEIYKGRNVNIKLLEFMNDHTSFMEEFKEYKNLHFTVVSSPEEIVDGSDVVISAATYLDKNVCEDKYFKKGVTVIPIHTRGFGNCDLFFDKVFADDTNHVCGFKYFNKFKSFAEVSDIVNGKKLGRENDDERILVYNIGIALHDIYFASKIYKKIGNSACEVDMKTPAQRYWF